MVKRLRCADKKKKVALAEGLNLFVVCFIRGINPFTEYWRCKLKKTINLLKEEWDVFRDHIQ